MIARVIYRFCLILIAAFLVLSPACKKKSRHNPTAEEDFDEEKLKEQIALLSASYARDTLTTNYYDTLSLFYKQRCYEPVWLAGLKSKIFKEQLLQTLDSSMYDGLDPQHYGTARIKKLLSEYPKKKGDSLYKCLAMLELNISNGIAGLWHDKVMGRTNPKLVLGSKYTLPYPIQTDFKLFAVLQADSGLRMARTYQPKHHDYPKLRNLLVAAFSNTDTSAETLIDTANIRKISPGDTSNISRVLARRLAELGYANDSLQYQVSGIIYDAKAAAAVKQFQLAHKLTDDGIIGKTTLKMLNASRNDRINEIKANMERLRWYDTEPEKPYILVNIPEFVLYLHYADSVKSMNVCVGKGKERNYDEKSKRYSASRRYLDKPMNHETPQIFSNIDYVILNPTWTVPSSIVGREMYGKIVRDPGYLPSNGYKVFSGKTEINPYTINWRQYGPANIPYTIRQDPGDDNSLGKIKFTFLNPFSVYMHDTPLKSKFKLSNRAVSHGCVRVENPAELAGFVLQHNRKNTYDDLRVMLGLEPVLDTARARKWREDTTSYRKIVRGTKPIRIENKMTVVFDYRTVVFDDAGLPHFYYDVYDKNRLITEAMMKP